MLGTIGTRGSPSWNPDTDDLLRCRPTALATALPLHFHCPSNDLPTVFPLPCHCPSTAFVRPFTGLSLTFHCLSLAPLFLDLLRCLSTAIPQPLFNLPLAVHCLSLTFHCLLHDLPMTFRCLPAAFPCPPTAFSLPLLDPPSPFHCLLTASPLTSHRRLQHRRNRHVLRRLGRVWDVRIAAADRLRGVR